MNKPTQRVKCLQRMDVSDNAQKNWGIQTATGLTDRALSCRPRLAAEEEFERNQCTALVAVCCWVFHAEQEEK